MSDVRSPTSWSRDPMERLHIELLFGLQFDKPRGSGRVAAWAIASASRSSFFCALT